MRCAFSTTGTGPGHDGNGDIGNQGVHEMDMARWGLLEKLHGPKVSCPTGGKYVYVDDRSRPTPARLLRLYRRKELQFEVRGLNTGGEATSRRRGNYVGNLFCGADGWMVVDGTGFKVYKGDEEDLAMEVKKEAGADTPPHMANFLAACRSRNYRDLHADVAIGVMSADLRHLPTRAIAWAVSDRWTPRRADSPAMAPRKQSIAHAREVPGTLDVVLSPPSSPPRVGYPVPDWLPALPSEQARARRHTGRLRHAASGGHRSAHRRRALSLRHQSPRH